MRIIGFMQPKEKTGQMLHFQKKRNGSDEAVDLKMLYEDSRLNWENVSHENLEKILKSARDWDMILISRN